MNELIVDDMGNGLRVLTLNRPHQLNALSPELILLLGESGDQESLTVRIGSENEVQGLRSTSVVATGYGSGDRALASLGVLGPTRMDYPTAMGAVRAVARYVGQILAES